MRNRRIAGFLTGAALCSLVGAAFAADTNDEGPNFAGVWARADESRFFPVPGDNEGKPLAQLPNPNRGIVAGDYNNPILQPWAREIVKRNAEQEQREEHVSTAHGTCWPSGVPEVLNLREPVLFLQQKHKITILYQRDHQSREILLTGKHSPNVKPSWYGESIGHYEGDTLVVDTIGQTTKTFADLFRTPHSERLHVVERFRLIDSGKKLQVEMTVDDPAAFVKPWKGTKVWQKVTDEPKEPGDVTGTFAEEIRCMDGEMVNPLNQTYASKLEPLPTDKDGAEQRLLSGQ
jgi:hypothetical protein